jgi:hypothetical protein
MRPVSPVLLDVRASQVKGPIAFFQAKQFSEKPMRELFLDIAKRAHFDTNQAARNFIAVWPQLLEDVRQEIRALRGRK